MHETLEDRVAALEARAEQTDRLLQKLGAWAPPTAAPLAVAPPPRPEPAPAPARQQPRRTPPAASEDRFAGQALAWGGAAATVLGLALLLVMAATRGWLGEGARVLLGTAFSLVLLVAGGRLYERRGRTEAAKAATATGIIGIDAALVVATSSYALLPPLAGLLLVFGVSAVMAALCLRWEARDLACATMLAALAAPALGAAGNPLSLGFLALGFVAVAAVCAIRDWPAVALGAFGLVTPQWVSLLDDVPVGVLVVVLVVFAAIGAGAAAGLEVREGRASMRWSASVLIAANGIVVSAAGALALPWPAAKAWLAGVAAAHLGAGALGRRLGAELRLTAVTLGVFLADIAAAVTLDGLWLAIAWALSTVLFAALARLRDQEPAFAIGGGVALHASLSVGHLLIVDAPPEALSGGFGVAGLLALCIVTASCLVSSRLTRSEWRMGLQLIALALGAYGTFAVTSGLALVFALAAEAAALSRLARREEDFPAAAAGAGGHLVLALGAALVLTDAVHALSKGLAEPLEAALMLLAVAGAAAVMASRLPLRPALLGLAALVVLHAVSAELVTLFTRGPLGGDSIGGVQRAQVALSAWWALAGLIAVIAGLVSDRRAPRIAGLSLLTLAAAKVLVYDLSALADVYRVVSCIALGLLLLAGGFAWQRLRPGALEDFRTVPAPLR